MLCCTVCEQINDDDDDDDDYDDDPAHFCQSTARTFRSSEVLWRTNHKEYGKHGELGFKHRRKCPCSWVDGVSIVTVVCDSGTYTMLTGRD